MKQLIQLWTVIVMSAWQISAQTVVVDQVDWSSQTPGATNGQSDNGAFWTGQGSDQDGAGTFGVSNGSFVFEDIEGFQQCPCIVSDPSPACGGNDNLLNVNFLLDQYCEGTITFDITTRGTLNCGTLNDQDVANSVVDVCPGDNGDQWLATDVLHVSLLNSENQEERILKFCGGDSESGSFTIDETFDIGELGTSISLTITGGTHNGGSYDIGNIIVKGIPRTNSALNASIITSHDNNVVCEGAGTIIVQTAANPLSQFTWAFPDGSTVSGNRNNGRDVLNLPNIDPSMSGTYRVTVVDDNLCELYDELDITILASNDPQCLARVSFGQLFPIQCSTDTLPAQDDNGITGVWTPGPVLEDYAGQTLEFTFTPDDPAVAPDQFLFTINDLSDFENFASTPIEIPILCNASDTTYDFIEMFSLNYTEFRLEVSGDLDLFDFIPNNSIGIVDAFIQEFRNIDVQGSDPKTVGFQIEAYADCGAEPITKSFLVTIIDPADPIRIDTMLCAGDFVDFAGFKIFGDTVIQGVGACDTMLIANVDILQPQITRLSYARSLSCGIALYYYDKVVNGVHIGFVDAPLSDPPPHGPDYDTVFTEAFTGLYTLPIPASNGCDSIQKMDVSFRVSNVTEVHFDLCSNRDTSIRVGSSTFIVDKETPYYYFPTGGCNFIEIDANILPAIADSLPHETYCASEVVPVEVAPGDMRDFDASMTYPYTVFLNEGANGCNATFVVDFTFIQPTRGTLVRRICPGESFDVGPMTFNQAVAGQDVLLSGGAASGCDSIVTVTVTVVEPETITRDITICEEDMHRVENVDFDINNPNGTVIVPSSLGCDSIIYEVTTAFYVVQDTIINPVICPGDEIPLNEYNYTIDQDNLTADLVGTTADGCNQNVLIRASIGPAILTDYTEVICAGDSYFFGGLDRTTTGSYSETLTAASGCDSISTVNLTVLPEIPETDDGNLSACQGLPVIHLGKNYDTPGTYRDTLQTSMGCDSIVVFDVSFDAIPMEDIGIQMTCPDQPITILLKDYSTEGLFQDTIQTVEGCDSIVSFQVVFHEIITEDAGVMMTCPDTPVEFLGNSYPDEGSYSETITSSQGCDSIVTFQVVFHEIITSDAGVMMTCPDEPLEYLGNTYPNEGSYTETLTSVDGCDSIVNFEVMFYEIITTDLGVMETCPGTPLFFLGRSYSTEGSYTETLTSGEGCDSIITFEVAFFEEFTTDLGVMETCPGSPVFFLGIPYSDEGSYSQTILSSDGCDSTLNFEVVHFVITTTDIGVITTCPEVPVTFNGQEYSDEGPYTVNLTSSDGCDSIVNFEVVFEIPGVVTVEATICAGDQFTVFDTEYTQSTDEVITSAGAGQNGCDSTVHLLLTVLEEIETSEVYDICDGSSVTIGTQTFSSSVVDEPVILLSQDFCDSTVLVTVNVIAPIVTDLGDVQVCGTSSYNLGDTLLTTDGPHSITYTAGSGCDSTVQLNIVRVAVLTVDIDAIVCNGEEMLMNGKSYTETGIYRDTLTSSLGCDSVLVIDVTVLDEIAPTTLPVEVICGDDTYEYNGETYSASGVYTIDLLSVNGCDSTVVLTIQQEEEPTTTIEATTCGNVPYSFNGETFTTTGVYPFTYAAASGCDSTVMLDLTVLDYYEIDLGVRQVCTGGSLQVGPHTLTAEDQYMLTLTSSAGCDSIIIVELDIVDMINVDLGTVTICEGESYDFADQTLTEAGPYTDMRPSSIGCDSITTINIEVTPILEVTINDLIGSCLGGANGSFVIDEIPGASPPFSISGLAGVEQIDALPFTVTGLAEGDYSFDIIDANGCMTFADVTITNDRDSLLTITSILVDPTGMYELILEYDGDIESIEWADIDGLSCYDCPNPSVDIEETTTFTVTVVDVEGCVSTAEITLTVDGIGNVYFPNVINPNSARGNHRFFPQTEAGNDAHFDLFVFDRWGNMVYEMLGGPVNDISFGWNGRYSDNRINTGVFVYSVRMYKDNGITRTFKGDVTVVE